MVATSPAPWLVARVRPVRSRMEEAAPLGGAGSTEQPVHDTGALPLPCSGNRHRELRLPSAAVGSPWVAGPSGSARPQMPTCRIAEVRTGLTSNAPRGSARPVGGEGAGARPTRPPSSRGKARPPLSPRRHAPGRGRPLFVIQAVPLTLGSSPGPTCALRAR